MTSHQTAHSVPAKVSRTVGPDAGHSTRAARIGLAYDIGLSPATFYGCQAAGFPVTTSLMAATAAAGGRLLWSVLRSRHLDAVAVLMLATYALGLALTLPTHDARLLLLRDPATSALTGLVFLASCATRTPAIAYLARRLPARGPDTPAAHSARRRLTALWGAALLAEAALRLVLVFTLPLSVVSGLSTAVEVVVVTALVMWTRRSRQRVRTASQAAARPTALGHDPSQR
ncbi:VC0807 family protein [Kitasatospora sp. NPDC101157]|uniref:VC0807 family protein n=1 Tax=Kitasatospora sp. NPDC101157 TaxID=3364098 RepID=UPI0038254B3C